MSYLEPSVPEINKRIFEFCADISDKIIALYKRNCQEILDFDKSLYHLIENHKNWLDGDRTDIHKLHLAIIEYTETLTKFETLTKLFL